MEATLLVTFKCVFLYVLSFSFCQWIKVGNKARLSQKDNQTLHLLSVVPVVNTLFAAGIFFIAIKDSVDVLRAVARALGYRLKLSIIQEVLVEGIALVVLILFIYLVVRY